MINNLKSQFNNETFTLVYSFKTMWHKLVLRI
jgi:hypothetical protein